MRSTVRILVGRALVIGLLFPTSLASPRVGSATLVRQLKFKHGQTTASVGAVLKPETNHVYRLRAKAGQEAHVHLLLSGKEKARTGDVLFTVQHVGSYIPGTDTQFLEGIYSTGNIDWSGKLPVTGQYEIWVFNPAVSDHFFKHPLGYRLEVTIK